MKRREFLQTFTAAALLPALPFEASAASTPAKTPAASATPYFGVFQQAPANSIAPSGWLLELLLRQRDGLALHHAASGFPFDTGLWTTRMMKPKEQRGENWWPYEQTAYLVDGLTRLGAVTRDPAVSAEANANLRYILDHPQPDGSLGPDFIGPTNWPHAVIFRALLFEYDLHRDPAILAALRKHYLGRPDAYGRGRDSVNVESILNLYAATADPALLAKAKLTYANYVRQDEPTSPRKLSGDKTVREHGVTFNETAKLPAILYLHTGDQAMLDASVTAYRKIDRDDMLASGLHSAQEFLEGNDPHLYHETCNVSDYTWSLGYLLMATGDATWADRIEKTVFNAGIGAITKDFKAHQYLSTPNQLLAANDTVALHDDHLVAYRPGHVTACCSGNVHRFLPNYALRQYFVTPQGGIAAVLYGPGTFSSTIGRTPVSIDQRTSYPFAETIDLHITAPRSVAFPLHLRIPAWTAAPTITINGKPWIGLAVPGTFATIDRTFAPGDIVSLHLPMPIRLRPFGDQAASVERGPLVFALKIAESAKPEQGYKTAPGFPYWDIAPASPWAYGYALDPFDPAAQVKVITRTAAGSPWDIGNSPIELEVPVRRVTNWKFEAPRNPILPEKAIATGPVETVTLVPFGATRIRMTVLPLLPLHAEPSPKAT